MTSFTQVVPALVALTIVLARFLFEVKTYRANGLGRSLINAIASCSLFTVRNGRRGPKISSCMTLSVPWTLVLKQKSNHLKNSERQSLARDVHDRWCDVISTSFGLSTVSDFVRIDQFLHPFEVSLIDNMAVRIGIDWVVRVEWLPSFDDFWHKTVFNCFRTENIVRCKAESKARHVTTERSETDSLQLSGLCLGQLANALLLGTCRHKRNFYLQSDAG